MHYRTGYRLLQTAVCAWIDELLLQYASWPEVVWVNGGELIGARAAKKLKQFGVPIVIYNNDDPTGGRDGHRFDSMLAALPAYDLCVVVREPNVREFQAMGARAVHKVWMSYDEVQHRPFENAYKIPSRFRSDIAFVGTWIRGEERDHFLMSLIQRGLNIAIWGDRWQKAPSWKRLKPYWRGHALTGRDYVAAIQGAKLNLGLLSKGNRDLHTTRSVEIPYAGGLLCAEHTAEHCQLYCDGTEAVFWRDAKECTEICKELLQDEPRREGIRIQGARRLVSNQLGNEDICRSVIDRLIS